MSTQVDIDGLEKFSNADDRQLTPFFVGRTEVLDDIGETCSRAFTLWKEGRPAEGMTRMIQGAPGAGKTAILSFLEEGWKGNANKPIVVRLEGPKLRDWSDQFEAIRDTLPASWGRRLLRRLIAHIEVTVKIRWIEMSVRRDINRVGTAQLGVPICLMIDEVQSLRTDETTGQIHPDLKEAFSILHAGSHGLPVVPVLSGLAHSRRKLGDASLRRFSANAIHTLSPLKSEDIAKSVDLFFKEFNIEKPASFSVWEKAIIELSNGWPQHLHNMLAILARNLVAVGGKLGALDCATVKRDFINFRTQYYGRVLTGSQACNQSIGLLAAVLAGMGSDGDRAGTIMDLIESSVREDAGWEWRLPKGMTPEDYYVEMLEAGILQENESSVTCPIPSLRAHVIWKAGLRGCK